MLVEREGALRFRGRGKRRQGCQRLDCSGRRGKKTPTLFFVLEECEEKAKAARVHLPSAEAFSGAVKHPVPW